jgi:hypothetical protein
MEQEAKVTRAAVSGADKGGVWVRMGDHEYKIAPLNFKALRELAPSIATLQDVIPGAMPSVEQMGVLVKLALASLQRNYPATTEDEVADVLDFGNFGAVLGAVMGTAGLTKREVPASGETRPL